MIRTVFGSNKSGIAYFPLLNAGAAILSVSTRSGNAIVDNGITANNIWNPSKNIDFATDGSTDVLRYAYGYSTKYTGNVSVKFLKGLKDVYSWRSSNADLDVMWNITDLESFLRQFPNLYSINITQQDFETPGEKGIIKGDFARIPNSVESILVTYLDTVNPTDLFLNFSNFSNQSRLKRFEKANGGLKVLGDLNKLPSDVNFFKIISASSGSAITYTAGKVWASSFDTLYLPIPLMPTENDNILIDLYNYVTTAIGGKLIDLKGYRSSASDVAVAGLIALGFTVNCFRGSKILDLPFQNNFTDYSDNAISMVAGNGNGLPSFVSGRNGTDYAVNFDAIRTIRTNTDLPINSDKLTVSFYIKGNVGQFLELSSTSAGVDKTFLISHASTTILRFISRSPDNSKDLVTDNANWYHFVMVIDRSLDAANELKVYKDKILSGTVQSSNNTSGDFINNILFIGGRNGAGSLNAKIQFLKIFNYPLSAAEIAAL